MVPRAPLPSEELEKGPTDGTRRRCVSAHTFGLPAARGGAAGIEGGKRKTANCQSHARMYILYNTRVREKQTKSKTCVCHNPQWLGRSAAAEHQLMLRDLARGGRRGGGLPAGAPPLPVRRRPAPARGSPPPPGAAARGLLPPPSHRCSKERPAAARRHNPPPMDPSNGSIHGVGGCVSQEGRLGGGGACCLQMAPAGGRKRAGGW